MFVNKMARYELLSPDAVEILDRGWRRIVSEIGVQFVKPEAVELFRQAGQTVDEQTVKLDPDFVLEQVAKAPREFDVQARNPANTVHIGGDHMVFSGVYGPPFVREADVRRDATMTDFRKFSMLAQSFPELDSAGGVICEPNDAPLDSRHLDMIFALQTLTDKIYMGNVVSGPNAVDTIKNDRDPLRWPRDHRADAGDDLAHQLQFAAALGRPHARRPVRVQPCEPAGRAHAVPPHGGDVAGDDPGRARPATWPRRSRESRSHSSSARDARSSSGRSCRTSTCSRARRASEHPSPRSACLCTGQLARHFGLPFRTGGGLTSSQTPDAQAGYEALMTMLPTFLAGTNWVMHSAGWLEGGLVELLREVHHRHRAAEDAAGRVHAARDRRGRARLRRPSRGRPWRPLPRRRAHDDPLPGLLLPARSSRPR